MTLTPKNESKINPQISFSNPLEKVVCISFSEGSEMVVSLVPLGFSEGSEKVVPISFSEGSENGSLRGQRNAQIPMVWWFL